MSTGHAHHTRSSQKTLVIALAVTLGYAAVEAVGGWLANSLALMSDAGHMLTDAVSLAAGAFAAYLAAKPASDRHSYGLQRAEVVGALFNVLFMFVVVAAIVVSAIDRLERPQPVQFGSVVLIGTIGLAVNLGVMWLLNSGQRTLNTRGAMLHVMGDLLGSVAAIAAGTVIWLTGWSPIDPLLSLFICVLIVISSVRLLLETLHVIMEGVPEEVELDEVQAKLAQAHPDIIGIRHLHVWTISSNTRALSAHVELTVDGDWEAALQRLQTVAAQCFEIDHPTFQPEFYSRDSEAHPTRTSQKGRIEDGA